MDKDKLEPIDVDGKIKLIKSGQRFRIGDDEVKQYFFANQILSYSYLDHEDECVSSAYSLYEFFTYDVYPLTVKDETVKKLIVDTGDGYMRTYTIEGILDLERECELLRKEVLQYRDVASKISTASATLSALAGLKDDLEAVEVS